MISECTIRKGRLADRGGSALVITMLLLVILTAIGIYAVSISTTEMNISLNSRVGVVTRNVAEAGAFFGIDQIPYTFPPGFDCTVTLMVGNNMTAAYTVTSDLSGALAIQAGYGANFRFAPFTIKSSTSAAPSGFTGSAHVDADVNYGPVPSGTAY